MSLYSDLRSLATDLLTEFDQGGIQLIQLTTGTGPADNPGAATETTYDLKAVAKGVSFAFLKEGLAVKGDLEVTSAPIDGVTVGINDMIVVAGKRYKIIQDMTVPAAGTGVAWKFIVRRGG